MNIYKEEESGDFTFNVMLSDAQDWMTLHVFLSPPQNPPIIVSRLRVTFSIIF